MTKRKSTAKFCGWILIILLLSGACSCKAEKMFMSAEDPVLLSYFEDADFREESAECDLTLALSAAEACAYANEIDEGVLFCSAEIGDEDQKKTLIVMVCRGTDSDVLIEKMQNSQALFDGYFLLRKRAADALSEYVARLKETTDYSFERENVIFFAAGYSRGSALAAAAAKRAAKELTDLDRIFVDTFASPRYQFFRDIDYRHFYNFVNTEDGVTDYPVYLKRFGEDISFRSEAENAHAIRTYLNAVRELERNSAR